MEKLTREQFDQAIINSPTSQFLTPEVLAVLEKAMKSGEDKMNELTARQDSERKEVAKRHLIELQATKTEITAVIDEAWALIREAQGIEPGAPIGIIETADGKQFTIDEAEGNSLVQQLGCACGNCSDEKPENELATALAILLGLGRKPRKGE